LTHFCRVEGAADAGDAFAISLFFSSFFSCVCFCLVSGVLLREMAKQHSPASAALQPGKNGVLSTFSKADSKKELLASAPAATVFNFCRFSRRIGKTHRRSRVHRRTVTVAGRWEAARELFSPKKLDRCGPSAHSTTGKTCLTASHTETRPCKIWELSIREGNGANCPEGEGFRSTSVAILLDGKKLVEGAAAAPLCKKRTSTACIFIWGMSHRDGLAKTIETKRGRQTLPVLDELLPILDHRPAFPRHSPRRVGQIGGTWMLRAPQDEERKQSSRDW